jgi:ABC-type glycerol-3-phosphate transport system permease component
VSATGSERIVFQSSSAAARRRRKLRRPIVLYSLLAAGAFVFGLPFYWLVIGSLKNQAEYNQFPPTLWPHDPDWGNYSTLFQALPFGQFLLNSAIVAGSVIVGVVVSSSLVGFAFARLRAPGRSIWFAILLGTIILPNQITIVPTFVLFSKLGWLNSFKPLTIPAFFGDAFSIFLIRQFFRGIPRDLDEAAMLDGCGYGRIFWHVFVPNSWPVLATVGIFAFINTWSDFFGPLIYLNDFSKMTASVGLAFLNTQHGSGSTQLTVQVMLAGSLVVMVPMLAVFILLQRYFVQAITMSGLKG